MKIARTTRRRRPIYVESRMRVPMEQLWDATQDPEQHQRWDLRFGSISYLPNASGEPQRFTFATKVTLRVYAHMLPEAEGRVRSVVEAAFASAHVEPGTASELPFG